MTHITSPGDKFSEAFDKYIDGLKQFIIDSMKSGAFMSYPNKTDASIRDTFGDCAAALLWMDELYSWDESRRFAGNEDYYYDLFELWANRVDFTTDEFPKDFYKNLKRICHECFVDCYFLESNAVNQQTNVGEFILYYKKQHILRTKAKIIVTNSGYALNNTAASVFSAVLTTAYGISIAPITLPSLFIAEKCIKANSALGVPIVNSIANCIIRNVDAISDPVGDGSKERWEKAGKAWGPVLNDVCNILKALWNVFVYILYSPFFLIKLVWIRSYINLEMGD